MELTPVTELSRMESPRSLHASNALVERMAALHDQVLASKGIGGKQSLLRVVRRDFTRIRHALLEVSSRTPESLLRSFFADEPLIRTAVAQEAHQGAINHLGFEVHEPLDLILYGFEHWIGRGRERLGLDVALVSSQRFVASAELQRRVNAFCEILRLKLKVEGRELLLELFDIHRPMPRLECERCRHSEVCSAREAEEPTFSAFLLQQDDQTPGPWCQLIDRMVGDTLRPVFRHDPIWHYALEVEAEDQVHRVHDLFRTLASRSAIYVMPYSNVVVNPRDRSVHTKIVNRRIHLELELVAHTPASSGGGTHSEHLGPGDFSSDAYGLVVGEV